MFFVVVVLEWNQSEAIDIERISRSGSTAVKSDVGEFHWSSSLQSFLSVICDTSCHHSSSSRTSSLHSLVQEEICQQCSTRDDDDDESSRSATDDDRPVAVHGRLGPRLPSDVTSVGSIDGETQFSRQCSENVSRDTEYFHLWNNDGHCSVERVFVGQSNRSFFASHAGDEQCG